MLNSPESAAGTVGRDHREPIERAEAVAARRRATLRRSLRDQRDVVAHHARWRADEVVHAHPGEVTADHLRREPRAERLDDAIDRGHVRVGSLGGEDREDREEAQVERAHELRLPLTPHVGSAGPRVCDGDQVQQPQRARVADAVRSVGNDLGVGDVASSCDVRQQQVQTNGGDQAQADLRREPGARDETLRDHGADVGVVSTVPFADVVEERGEQHLIRVAEFLRDLHGAGVELVDLHHVAHLSDSAHHVDIDGVDVERRDVRAGAQHLPLRQQARERWGERQRVERAPGHDCPQRRAKRPEVVEVGRARRGRRS